MATAGSSTDDYPPVDDARDELQAAVSKAAETLTELLEAEDETVRIRAAKAILDRAGVMKAKQITSTAAARNVGGEDPSFDSSSDLF